MLLHATNCTHSYKTRSSQTHLRPCSTMSWGSLRGAVLTLASCPASLLLAHVTLTSTSVPYMGPSSGWHWDIWYPSPPALGTVCILNSVTFAPDITVIYGATFLFPIRHDQLGQTVSHPEASKTLVHSLISSLVDQKGMSTIRVILR